MIVTLDGEHLDGAFAASGTMRTLIDRVRQAQLGDRLVVSVAIDGEQLLDQELSDRLDLPLDGIQRLDLASADCQQLVADAFREVAERLERAGREQADIADLLHAGSVAAAVGRLGELLSAWQACHQVILECSGLLGRDLTAVACDGRPVREHLADLADRLRELRDAFDARDMVLLGDLVRYEMPEICQAWRGILSRLADQAVAPTGDACTPAP